MCRTKSNRGGATIEEAIAASSDKPARSEWRPRKPHSRRDVVVVVVDNSGVDAGSHQRRCGISDSRRAHLLNVISYPGIQSEVGSYPPVVLQKETKLVEVGIGCWAR